MKLNTGFHMFWRITATLLLITYSVACTHVPSGEKAFESFETCFAANLGLAAAGGVGVGVLSGWLGEHISGSSSTGKKVGTAAGVATAVMIGMTAWRKCGAVYNKSERVASASSAEPPPAPSAGAAPPSAHLNLDRLEVHVEGTENDPPLPEFDFSFTSANPAAKDIKAKFRHRVEIVRFKAADNDRLVLADDRGEALHDKSGKEIPLEAAARIPRERLSWVPIAEEGKEDYVEDVVIQQRRHTSYRHKLQVPPRAKLPLPLPVPMRYTLNIEAENMKTTRSVDFSILGTGARPKHYGASSHASALKADRQPAQSDTQTTKGAAASASAIMQTVNQATTLFSDTTKQRKPVAALAKGARIQVRERVTAIVNNKPEEWVKVAAESGKGGWLPASHLSEAK